MALEIKLKVAEAIQERFLVASLKNLVKSVHVGHYFVSPTISNSKGMITWE
jgi:hypothetical protein